MSQRAKLTLLLAPAVFGVAYLYYYRFDCGQPYIETSGTFSHESAPFRDWQGKCYRRSTHKRNGIVVGVWVFPKGEKPRP
jgi:hypothetical protein